MKHIAIIPARDGSKSIKNKNLQILGKTTLAHRAVDQALKAKIFSKVYLTTDIPALVDEFKNSLEVALRHRPAPLCTDLALMKDVVLDCLENYGVPDAWYFWLLQPTSPFRDKKHFQEIVELIGRHDAKSVISVKDVGANHPNRMYTIKKNNLYPLRYTNFNNKQELIEAYIRNGCFYVSEVRAFKKEGSFTAFPCVPYLMEEGESINIDGPMDLLMAQAVEAHR